MTSEQGLGVGIESANQGVGVEAALKEANFGEDLHRRLAGVLKDMKNIEKWIAENNAREKNQITATYTILVRDILSDIRAKRIAVGKVSEQDRAVEKQGRDWFKAQGIDDPYSIPGTTRMLAAKYASLDPTKLTGTEAHRTMTMGAIDSEKLAGTKDYRKANEATDLGDVGEEPQDA